MAISRNGWDVYESYSHPKLVNFPWVTGKVRDGDHFVVLDYIARRIHNEVEKIVKAHSWGHNPRPVRGYTNIWSEHATGTCFDFNAPKNGLGVSIHKSFSKAQIARIRQIIKDVQGAARWGGEWSRPDGMHVELIGGNAKVKAVANLIRAGKLPGGSVKPVQTPKPTVPAKPAPKPVAAKQWPYKALLEDGDFGKVTVKALQELLKGVKHYSGYIDGDFGKLTKIALQKWLKQLGHYDGLIDGNFGPMTVKALQQFLVKKGELPNSAYVDGNFGKVTKKAFQSYINSQAKHYK